MTDNNTDITEFGRILNEWTNAVTAETKEAKGVAEIMGAYRLGSLGQRLLYQAYSIGLDAALQALREKV